MLVCDSPTGVGSLEYPHVAVLFSAHLLPTDMMWLAFLNQPNPNTCAESTVKGNQTNSVRVLSETLRDSPLRPAELYEVLITCGDLKHTFLVCRYQIVTFDFCKCFRTSYVVRQEPEPTDPPFL